MHAGHPVAAALAALFLLGYAINGFETGLVLTAMGLLSWAVWPKDFR